MKILILVLSYNEPPFSDLMKMQQETWDSIEHPDVGTVYYYGGVLDDPPPYPKFTLVKNIHPWSIELGYQVTDEYYRMAGKFSECLYDVLNPHYAISLELFKDFDYIFRTNSSSYVNKKKLVEFAATLPTEKLYAGWTMHDSNSEDKGMAVSGAGIWLSRDCAEILREQINPNFEMEEDIYCGRILRDNGIVPIDDQSRFDVMNKFQKMPLDLYHYRFKTNDRLRDCENMKFLHNKIAFQ